MFLCIMQDVYNSIESNSVKEQRMDMSCEMQHVMHLVTFATMSIGWLWNGNIV